MTRVWLIVLAAVIGSFAVCDLVTREAIAVPDNSRCDANEKRGISDILKKGDWIWVSPPPTRKGASPNDSYVVHILLSAKNAERLTDAEQGPVLEQTGGKFNPIYKVTEVGSDFVAFEAAAGLFPVPGLIAHFDEIFLPLGRIRLIGAHGLPLPKRKK